MQAQTQIIRVNTEIIEPDKIKIITDILKQDGVIIYPTDTFYGLGANCFSEKAVQRIYRHKKREPTRALSVVISDFGMVEKIAADIPSIFKRISDEFWPGPLTLILKASNHLPRDLVGKRRTIGVRLPALYWLRKLVKKAGFPVAATSANVSGGEETNDPENVIKTFQGKVDLIVDGGKTKGILPSTVLDLTTVKPKILREGAIPISRLRKYLE